MKTFAVLPAYNEANRIGNVIKETLNYVDQIIVIDDGSTDNTSQVIDQYSERVIKVKHKINLGKGAALKTGCETAIERGAEIIITLDSDGQHKPSLIPKFIKEFNDNEVEIVFGSRSIGRDMPIVKMIGNKLLSLTSSILFGIYISDTQSGFRAFRASTYPKLKWDSSDYSVESEVVSKVGKKKLKYKEIDIETIYTNIYKGTTFIDGIRIFINMLIWKIK